MSNVRKTLATVAAIVLVSLTAACNSTDLGGGTSGEDKPAGVSKVADGGTDKGTDDDTKGVTGGAGNPAICAEALAATGDFMTKVMAAPTDHQNINKAISGHADTLKKLSGRADGDLKTALSEMVAAFSQLDVNSATVGDVSKKADVASKKLLAACS
ncbi:hypothetical protein [Microtetraspora malaysiensis]|uniref:hypothetical protein n=1 Tax=Microtetraspora malaysiensis TaxID=161358 RepID=UPI003D916A21